MNMLRFDAFVILERGNGKTVIFVEERVKKMVGSLCAMGFAH